MTDEMRDLLEMLNERLVTELNARQWQVTAEIQGGSPPLIVARQQGVVSGLMLALAQVAALHESLAAGGVLR